MVLLTKGYVLLPVAIVPALAVPASDARDGITLFGEGSDIGGKRDGISLFAEGSDVVGPRSDEGSVFAEGSTLFGSRSLDVRGGVSLFAEGSDIIGSRSDEGSVFAEGSDVIESRANDEASELQHIDAQFQQQAQTQQQVQAHQQSDAMANPENKPAVAKRDVRTPPPHKRTSSVQFQRELD